MSSYQYRDSHLKGNMFSGYRDSQYSAVPLKCGQFSHKSLQKKSHSSPVRARYGVCLVDSASDWYSVPVPAVIYAISYCFGPRYNGTLLYKDNWLLDHRIFLIGIHILERLSLLWNRAPGFLFVQSLRQNNGIWWPVENN